VKRTENRTRKQVCIRLSEQELARVKFLAEHYEVSMTAVVRLLVKREYDGVKRGLR
jgi:hypothetical protein